MAGSGRYTYAILFVGCLVILAVVMYYHRKETENSLLQIYAVAVKANNMESALADSSRYEAILLDINNNEEKLQSILHRVSFTDRLLGRSTEVDSLADQTSKMLQMQKLRIYNLNNKSINLYHPTVFLYLIQIFYLLENQEGFCKRGNFPTTFPQQFQLV